MRLKLILIVRIYILNFKFFYFFISAQIPEKDKTSSVSNKNVNENRQEINNNSSLVAREIPNLNLSESMQKELRSHFDVVRKLGYFPDINSLISISEVKFIHL